MDDAVRAAMAKWPDVPAVFGWLSLDARGRWRVSDTPVQHAGLAAFIGRNYQCDKKGRWYFQNGPQQVFVTLEYTPWVFRLETDGTLSTHTDAAVDAPSAAWLDEDGHLLISDTDGKIGVVHDADLAEAIERFRTPAGDIVDAGALLDTAHWPTDAGITLARGWLPLSPIRRSEVAGRFGFVTDPTDKTSTSDHCRP